MKIRNLIILLLLSISFTSAFDTDAKKIRKTLKVAKPRTESSASEPKNTYKGIKIKADSTACEFSLPGNPHIFNPDSISFSGYDKNINSSRETFLITNSSPFPLSAFHVKIVYYDMNGLMLHSRVFSGKCSVPPGETRKTDIPTWDKQFSYYYYLGNEPRKVATPFKVDIIPMAFWIIP